VFLLVITTAAQLHAVVTGGAVVLLFDGDRPVVHWVLICYECRGRTLQLWQERGSTCLLRWASGCGTFIWSVRCVAEASAEVLASPEV
jgi:hypothetical protein